MKRIKCLNTTFSQIFFSSAMVMVVAFLCIGGYLYKNMSAYILQQSSKYIRTAVQQTQERFNSSFSEIDTNLQRLCNDYTIQTMIRDYNLTESFPAESFSSLRLRILETMNYASDIASVEIFSKKGKIYPYTKENIRLSISKANLELADKSNGKVVWLMVPEGDTYNIIAVKRILLSDYSFEHGGYLVVVLKQNLIDSILSDLKELENYTFELTDSAGTKVYYGKKLTEEYHLTNSTSSYSGWKFSIFVPKKLANEDTLWLGEIVIYGFLIGTGGFLVCSLMIARMISRPLSDMKKSMVIADGKLQRNKKEYFNLDINELNTQYNHLVRQNNELIEQLFEKELLRAKAEITALQAQVNPHFIINALESLYWSLIQKNDMVNAKILMAMAKLFQYILKGGERVSMQEELSFVEQYLQVEKFRFGERLTWEYDTDPELDKVIIPRLLIHPLVENTMKYAVEKTAMPVHIFIRTFARENGYGIEVTDNGPGISSEILTKIKESFHMNNPVGTVSESYGLANINRRVCLYFGKSSQMSVESDQKQRVTKITIQIDLRE